MFAAPALAADCPQSCVSFCYALPVCSSDSTGQGGYYGDIGSFDIPNGHLTAQSSCGLSNCCVTVTVDEEFRLEGLAPGTPVNLVARFDATLAIWHGYAGDGGVEAAMSNAAVGEVTWSPVPPDTLIGKVVRDSVLTLPLSVQAGVPFRVQYELRCATAETFAWADGAFSFDGLPVKSSILSCRGFTQIPVPTTTTTWGSVKARYR